ncbi:LamB/YcsF family protein [Natronoglycomyces albus]|uniref:LamB/YcsF family protein n=1 Tax=Natronoglycomyces albus TaxID=2811108 RepID=A0A895XMM3_9ACTN|nr:LamB/YcsF family protein [Natronoglycomyces albus]
MDLNADLGEGFGRWELTDDHGLLKYITSANVACGFHAGDPSTMRRVCEEAVASGVRIGAQVSYRDLAGFGRREMDVPSEELAAEIAYQIGALRVFAQSAGSDVTYVKPHGALYHRVIRDPEQARAVVEGIKLAAGPRVVLCLTGGELDQLAQEEGMTTVGEGFADRAYGPDGWLVSRSEPHAVHHDPHVVVSQALSIAQHRTVVATNGRPVNVKARSLCLHGDSPGAVAMAASVRQALKDHDIDVEAFT